MFIRLLTVCLLVLATFGHQANGFCNSDQYECDNGQCIRDDNPECDGYEDCDDGSDEDSCVDVVGIAVGVSVAGFVLFIVCPIIICLIIWCCLIKRASSATNRRPQRVVTAYPTVPMATAPMATMVTAHTEDTDYFPKQEPPPPYYGQPQPYPYPAQPYPAPGYPPPVAYPPHPGYPTAYP